MRVVELHVDAQGNYTLNSKSVPPAELKHELRALRNAERNVELLILTTPNTEFQAVGKAVVASQEAGIAVVKFATGSPP